jgi:predicted PurR-regulated permease PerM
MDRLKISENKQLALLIGAIYIICIVAFWPLMPVFVWSAAIAVALMSFHKQLSRIVKPSVSVTFITVWVFLIILLALSVSASILYGNIDHIGSMVASMVQGFQNTGVSAVMPALSEQQFSHMPDTLIQLLMQSLLSLTSNVMQSCMSIIIFFLSLSMLLLYGEEIGNTLTQAFSPKLYSAVEKMVEISSNTIYALIIVQISAAVIAFALALPFFYLMGVDEPFLFATLIGIATLIPLFGSQIMLLFFALYFISMGDFRNAVLTLVIGYPLLSAWIDFYYRPVVMGKRVAIPPVMMMIGILAGVPFMGIVGFIIGPVLIALAVTGTRMLGEVVHDPESGSVQS